MPPFGQDFVSDQGGAASYVFLCGLALLVFILLVRSRRYFRTSARRDSPPPRPKHLTARDRAAAVQKPRDQEQWEVQMHELARDLSGQIDSKLRLLQNLVRLADQAAARLESALDRAAAPLDAAPLDEPEPDPPPKPAESPQAAARAAPHGQPESSPATFREFDASGEAFANSPRFERIYALADAGMSPARIAGQVGSQIGEVELILSLRGDH